jgi:PleD family two-component response regulator
MHRMHYHFLKIITTTCLQPIAEQYFITCGVSITQHLLSLKQTIMTTKILWIDDEMDSLKSQIMFLENKGYNVETFSNGYDGLEYLKANHVDVVLLDESMPGMTGL